MQLKTALSLATASLLGSHVATGFAENQPWQIEAASLFYSESDSRVTAIEPVISAKKNLSGDRTIAMKLVLDSLTGASPNGAVPTDAVQTFTRPSGNGSYTVSPGDLPKDDTFKDTRGAFSLNWSQPHSDVLRGQYGVNLSSEYDFTSFGMNAGWAYDMNQRNTTINLGVGAELDSISPEGGIPATYATMQPVGTTPIRSTDSDSKQVFDLLAGITQVINRRTLMQWNYSISQSSGYLTDPFKILSVLDDNTGALITDSPYRYEGRPDSRLKQSLYWETKYRFDRDRVDISYRYLWDDWGITSHTIDSHYQWNFAENHYLEPHVRFYQQSAADFYKPFLLKSQVDNNQLPTNASADLRLAQFNATTLGVKYGHKLSEKSECTLRAEWYQQTGDPTPKEAFGAVAQQDLFPTLNAFIMQASYSFLW